MDTSNQTADISLNYVNFNQDQVCFACGFKWGFGIYNCDPLKLAEKIKFPSSGIGFIEMLFRCNLMAIVGDGSNEEFPKNRLLIWDDLKKKVVIKLDFNSDIYAVRLRRDRIIVALEGLIKVYTLTEVPHQLHVFETSKNRKGLCVVCPNSRNSVLAFPSRKVGCIDLMSLCGLDNNTSNPVRITAHQTAISCLALNEQGTLLATASEKGTLIRVFDTKTAEMVVERRRGAQQANIYSICFNHNSTGLCVSSDHGTVHIFSLDDNPNLNRVSSLSTMTFLPKYFASVWSFCKFTIPNGPPCICAFGADNSSIIILCADGFYYKFLFNEKGESSLDVSGQFVELAEF